jgi:DNA-binding protein YbaB
MAKGGFPGMGMGGNMQQMIKQAQRMQAQLTQKQAELEEREYSAASGGGMVNVNIQLASLKERVREVGVKMAIGAPGREIFKAFMTEALLLTLLGSAAGYVIGIVFSWSITKAIGIPLSLAPMSFIWAYKNAPCSPSQMVWSMTRNGTAWQ